MSMEDRVRAATRARTDLVRDIRPLEFPDEMTAPAPQRRAASRWLTWGAPIAAAALVTALALSLALLRQAGGPQPAPAGPASGASATASIPRYYVALAQTGSTTSAQLKAVVGDDRTGRAVAVLNPSASQNFYGVTGAADDRTFVVMNYTAATQQTTWYLLRLTPGAAHPARLTELPIKPVVAHINGLALSPDGRELAVMWRTATTATNAVTYLSVYSMSTGAALGTWNTHAPNDNVTGGTANSEDLTWLGNDRQVDFQWAEHVPATVTVNRPNGTTARVHAMVDKITLRSLNVTAAGHDLLAESRLVMTLPATATPTKTKFSALCAASVIGGDGTLVCGTSSFSDVSFEEVCSTVPPSFVTYSGTTGKRLKVLYQYHGQCLEAQAMPVWTDASASHVIAFLLLSEKGVKTSATDKFGLITGGRFTPLPKLVVGSGDAVNLGGLAF
jgi:hypothetical protein